MGVQFRRRLLSVAGLLFAVGMLSTGFGEAQRPTGSLVGLLTDTHSAPLENLPVMARNPMVTNVAGSCGMRSLRVTQKIDTATMPRCRPETTSI